MNTGFYKDLDTNFEIACKMAEKSFDYKELIELLKSGNIPEKQIAALKLEKLESDIDAQYLINNLTGCDGKIREAVALKINKLLKETPKYCTFFNKYADVFADATIDINANICRLVIDSVSLLKKDSYFSETYLKKIKESIAETFKELDNFIFRDKKYIINKQIFKLYWCLEALKLFVNEINSNELLEILERSCLEREYTIREKAAQIIKNTNNEKFDSIKIKLKKDENYYVRIAIE